MLTANGADVEVDDQRDATGGHRRTMQATVGARAERWPGIMADVAAAVARRSAAVSGDVYEVILREVPQLRDDTPVLALLASSVDSRAEESLGRPVGENRHDVELALRVSHWLGSLVLRPAPAGPT